MTTVLKVPGHSEYRHSQITCPIPKQIRYTTDSPPITKMASEDRTGSDVEHIYIQVVEFCNIWLTINVGLGNFLRLDAGFKYNDETGISSLCEIRNRTATCGCDSEAQNLKIHEGRISFLLR